MILFCNENIEKADGITRVPPRPGKIDRFVNITGKICSNLGIGDYTRNLVCIEDYQSQKSLGLAERMENIRGKFRFDGPIPGMHIILIDDVMTSGATALECARVLYEKGACSVTAIVLGINQFENEWRSSNHKELLCSKCNGRMFLRINSKDNSIFFGCENYKQMKCASYSYVDGVRRLLKANDIMAGMINENNERILKCGKVCKMTK